MVNGFQLSLPPGFANWPNDTWDFAGHTFTCAGLVDALRTDDTVYQHWKAPDLAFDLVHVWDQAFHTEFWSICPFDGNGWRNERQFPSKETAVIYLMRRHNAALKEAILLVGHCEPDCLQSKAYLVADGIHTP